MSSSALDALVACAKAIQDENLTVADSLLERIWNLAAAQSWPGESDVVKYFAEALVRRAYGISSASAYFTLLIPSPINFLHNFSCDAINTACMGKKRLHLITFLFRPFYYWRYLFRSLANASGDFLSVRVSVILSPFLKKIVKIQQEKSKHDLTMAAVERGIKLEDLRVVYANSLGDVDASKADFTRTTDEAVIVYYRYKLHELLADVRVMERELLKLRQINPEIVIIEEQYADHNDSNFIKRLEKSFQYYFNYLDFYELMYYRREIVNIVECEARDRLKRHQTLAQWRSLLRANGLLPVPLAPDIRSWAHEDNGCMVFQDNDRPLCFISAWKLTDAVDHFNPISSNPIQGIFLMAMF
ncbi:Transcription factor GRAS - like 10 [Theobroma cacao]|nr:Transcription factor GRAS - like 10 [Theobroma cacao]